MNQAVIDAVQKSQLKTNLPKVTVGDTVDVHVRITEGTKERIQIFNGVIIKIQGAGLNKSITVRRIVANQGVERIFPLHSPQIASIEVKHHGHTRRAKLYYLRERVGKKRRLRDRQRGLGNLIQAEKPPGQDQQSEPDPAAESDQPLTGETDDSTDK